MRPLNRLYLFATLSLCPSLAHAQDEIAAQSPLLSSIEFADPALQTCVRNYAATQQYVTVADVKEIPCWNLGITSIKGLELFTDALVIDLSRNQIRDWTPLFGLQTRLGYLDIHDNPITCSDMISLAKKLPRATLIGFDLRKCSETIPPEQPQPPVPPTAPQPPAPQPPSPKPAEPTPPDTGTPSYAAIAEIVTAHCGPCHQNGRRKGGVTLDGENNLVSSASEVLRSIQRNRMPPRARRWQSTRDGLALVAYLKAKGATKPGDGDLPRGGDDDDDDDHKRGGHDDDDD